MNYFSKKTNTTLLIISLLGFLISGSLILFANNISNFIYLFLQNVVFKREFDFSKWADTINSLIAFPIFIVIFVDALLFPKFTEKTKLIIIFFVAFLAAFFIIFCSVSYGDHFMDSDMASELLLAKECYLHKTFLPPSWNYSTEIRMLNTQIFTAPLFFFTKNLVAVKTISVFIISLLLPLSLLFLLSELNIHSKWTKTLCLLLVYLPWSSPMWGFAQYGSYYIPHIAIAFTYISLFLAITYNKNKYSLKTYRILAVLFLLLSFISGLSGIRYILYFEFPLCLTVISLKTIELFKNKNLFKFKDFFINEKSTFFCIISLLLGAFGYVFNNLILAHIYSFSDFNTTAFTHIGDINFSKVQNDIFEILGYKNYVSVFTPSGVINVLIYIGVCFFILCFIDFSKKTDNEKHKVFITFTAILIIFNSFTIINTEYIARYFILILPFIIPCLALFQDSQKIFVLKKYILTLSFSIFIITSSFIVFEDVICSKGNKDKENITKFLKENNYEYGYGTFWNANVFTYLTNDKVKLANLLRHKFDDYEMITEKFECDKWLTPDSYYADDFGNNNKIILIVTSGEFNASPEANIFKNGKKVFEDQYYLVFEYENNNIFKASF